MRRWLKGIVLGVLTLVVVVACSNIPEVQTSLTPTTASAPQLSQLKFGVGPYFPTPGENNKQFEPLFKEAMSNII